MFWDTDVFVVPALAAMAPALARSALGYRTARIEAAMARARREGRRGARFPWESANDGDEVTPTEGVDLRGRTVPIRTGEQEEHVVADIAWSALRYLDWTGDEAFRRGPATRILVETARYWQSRVELDDDGSGHLTGVIGPDEYHEDVDGQRLYQCAGPVESRPGGPARRSDRRGRTGRVPSLAARRPGGSSTATGPMSGAMSSSAASSISNRSWPPVSASRPCRPTCSSEHHGSPGHRSSSSPMCSCSTI